MNPDKPRPTEERLRDYWDAFVSDEAPPADDLDPELAEAVQAFHALDDAPAPDPALMAGIWEALIGEPLPTVPLEATTPATVGVNGHRPGARATHELARSAAVDAARRPLLHGTLRVYRLLALGTLAGFVAGFFAGGLGARLAMLVAGALTDGATRRRLTENEEVVGRFSLGGTIDLALTAGIFFGVGGGLLYVAVRSYLPGTGARRGLLYGGFLLATLGFVVMDKNNPDYRTFGSPGINVGAFSLVYILFGLAVAPLADWLDRRLPRWPRRGGVGWRAIVAHVAFLPFALTGLSAIVALAGSVIGLVGLLVVLVVTVALVRRFLGGWLAARVRLPRPALVPYALLAAPSLVGFVLTVRSVATILGVG